MRLTEKQRTDILQTSREIFGPDATVTLFGSRVDDTARGGDIDLMVTTGMNLAAARHQKIRFLVRLKKRIGDRRIDVVLRTPDSEERAIHRVASTEGVLIQ
ncbi:MAG: nucleotidyltransferase domain-containing protein [Spirochaetaceae bacterium]|nr:MAG: nucleotidyltransferase domain-containing protein [Spirochaetaceae bacterium]